MAALLARLEFLPGVSKLNIFILQYLQIQMDGGRHLSKRAKKKLQKAANESTNLAQSHSNQKHLKTHHSDAGNADLCAAALAALISFLDAVNCLLKPVQVRTIQQHIVQQCLTVALHAETRDQLYYASASRSALYGALFALTTNSHHLAPPPMQYVLDLLTTAANTDFDLAIRELCRDKLLALGRTLRPERPNLHFEADPEELESAIALLKKDRADSEDGGDDNDEIVEEMEVNEAEPVAKRPKLAEQPSAAPEPENGDADSSLEEPVAISDDEESEQEILQRPENGVEREVIDVDADTENDVEIIEPEEAKDDSTKLKSPPILTDTETDAKVEEMLQDFVDD